MNAVDVVPLQIGSIPAAAGVLARSFAEDPGLIFVLPDAEQRNQLAPVLARLGLQALHWSQTGQYAESPSGSPQTRRNQLRLDWKKPELQTPLASLATRPGLA